MILKTVTYCLINKKMFSSGPFCILCHEILIQHTTLSTVYRTLFLRLKPFEYDYKFDKIFDSDIGWLGGQQCHGYR
jgi:hypothetical protein